ncbi:MAG: FixH family protein, partial [Acidimicrobiales bacterium]
MALTPAPARRPALVVAAMAVFVGLAGPAAAHGGGAVFEVLRAAESAPGEVILEVQVTYESDGEPAEGAIVEVTASGPGGATAGPVPAERQDEPGVYTATLDLAEPGPWVLAVTSSFPPGTIEVPTEVTGEGPAAEGPSEPALDEPEVGGAEGGSDATNLVTAAVFGLLGGALGLWVSRRWAARRRAAKPD